MKIFSHRGRKLMLHLVSKILIIPALLLGPLAGFGANPLPQVMGASDQAFGASGHPYLLFSPERVAKLRAKLTNNVAGATKFKTIVDKQVDGAKYYAFESKYVAFMYPITGDDKYCQFAVESTDRLVTLEEENIKTFADGGAFKVLAAYDSFLYVGKRVGGVAAVYDWCYGALTSAQKQRWIAYGNEVLFNLWNYKEAVWGGRAKTGNGYATGNPLNNYYYSFLEATMYFGLATQGDNPEAEKWLTLFRDNKVETQMLPKFASIKGGGSAEGTGYGTSLSRIFKLMDWWEDSTWKKADGTILRGEKLYNENSLARESLDYMLHTVVPSLSYLSPLGDHARDSTARFYDSHREYLLVLSSLYPTATSAKAAKTMLQNNGFSSMGKYYTAINDFLYANDSVVAAPLSDLPNFYYAETVGHIFSRTDWSPTASYFSASIGPYHEVHDHRDKNSFVFFKDEWLAYDQNINTHAGTYQHEVFHSMVRFDNLDNSSPYQGMIWRAPEPIVHAVVDTPAYTYVSADTFPLYEDRKTKVNLIEQYKRDMVYLKPNVLIVYDQLRTTAGHNIKKTWQLQSPFTPQYVAGSNVAVFQGGASSMKVTTLLPAAPSYSTVDYLDSIAKEKYRDAAG
ncbi:MAG: hypothetical protein JKY01_09525, partial [Pseudomonadales bacterium]|nr:hypothetical protein [Pseudomonadales bacterium]